ncbi:MAG: alkaline phosphatase family protein [Anaerolineales bacterium]|nr:alkaline phosphatase family protein [Anaerolineales bacterium]
MRTIILGFDAFDPVFCEELLQSGRMPNLARFLTVDGYRRFEVTNPPQSEVSWTSIATGLNPGGHGIFDFVHRDPKTYTPFVSLLPTKRGFGGVQFAPPYSAPTLFDQTAKKGFPATSLFWPATFPARPDSLVKSIPGLGTPDILGRLGVGSFFSTGRDKEMGNRKTPVETLQSNGKDCFRSSLKGPSKAKLDQEEAAVLPFEIGKLDDRSAELKIGSHRLVLQLGQWSQIFGLSFKMGTFVKVNAITQVILTSLEPELNLYFLPLQIDPLHSPWHYAVPPKFVKNTWKSNGPFLTIGWPQDTTGLEDGCMNDEQFLALCDSIFESRERILMHQIGEFNEGVLASVFDSLDRIQHMFWRDHPEIIENWYIKLDNFVGRVEKTLKAKGLEKARILVVSDHGFSNFDQKIHLNRWLIENGYLVSRDELDSGKFKDVNWQSSQAYGLGLNSIYLNLVGREGQGIVENHQVDSLTNQIRDKLLEWKDRDGKRVVNSVPSNAEALSGPLAKYGPDLIVGYAPGFRASPQTGLGEWEKTSMEVNQDHWGADHCIDPKAVPGVLFSNQGLGNFPHPSYHDFPVLATGEEVEGGVSAPPPSISDEDQEMLEERLKSLGYL